MTLARLPVVAPVYAGLSLVREPDLDAFEAAARHALEILARVADDGRARDMVRAAKAFDDLAAWVGPD